jgi:hypothetical protein
METFLSVKQIRMGEIDLFVNHAPNHKGFVLSAREILGELECLIIGIFDTFDRKELTGRELDFDDTVAASDNRHRVALLFFFYIYYIIFCDFCQVLFLDKVKEYFLYTFHKKVQPSWQPSCLILKQLAVAHPII